MKQSSVSIPQAIMLREIDNKGIRRVTLRKNFSEETDFTDGQENTYFGYDETDVFIVERNNIMEFITNNFANLFELGLRQSNELVEMYDNENALKRLLEEGRLVGELKLMGQQITEIMLEVM